MQPSRLFHDYADTGIPPADLARREGGVLRPPWSRIIPLAEYCQYRQIGDLNGLRQRHPELARIDGEAAAPPTDD